MRGVEEMVEVLLEERETQPIHYYCLSIGSHRYDFTIVYSHQFFDKAMVVSMQAGKWALMCQEDIENEEFWAERLGIVDVDIEDCKAFFKMVLNHKRVSDQY